jgi:TPR repeat protein/serine/threonine protein kinase
LDSRVALPPNTVLDGTYRIVRTVGSGGFGITYEAEDLNLATTVALKEYYPDEYGDRDARLSVRAKSERHKQTFEWGRSNFLKEARTLARFEHPSIVRVTRVFEANSTAYMVMGFERGQSFEAWLKGLGRPPTQEELDAIVAPLLSALELMHASDFLHRDIAPDNIIVRMDGTPVLLDFGAARRAVAEITRMMTGIVKAGYSPHEQYSSNNRLQGPWSDIYALGGTLYRAVTGSAPEEATLRVDDDRMAPATLAAKGEYRPEFLAAIDACLVVRHADRPRSVAQLRPMLLGTGQRQPVEGDIARTRRITSAVVPPTRASRWIPLAALALLIGGGVFGVYEFMNWQPKAPGEAAPEAHRKATDLERTDANADAERRPEAEGESSADERRSLASRDDAKPKDPAEPPRTAQPPARQGRLLRLPVTLRALSDDAQRGWLGVNTEPLELSLALFLGLPNADGIFIFNKTAGGPADQAGVQVGDVLVRANDNMIANAKDLRTRLASIGAGGQAIVEVWRLAVDDRDFLQLMRELADTGNVQAPYLLGRMYAAGIGTARDDPEAMRWFRKGADAGNISATTALANMLLEGRGAEADPQEGLRLLRVAAAKDDVAAMNRLGHILADGKITAKDAAESTRWYTKAAEAGHTPSMFQLGSAYYSGIGVQADSTKAAMWYKQAADLGNAGAMTNLGWLHENGKGVELDLAKAIKLYTRAADLNNSGGMVNLAILRMHGKGIERNEAAAVALYKKAMDLGNAVAMNNLAWLLQGGMAGQRKDPEEAADLMMKALDRRNEFALKQMTQNSRSWSREFRQALQRRLREAGFYAGPTDGEFRDTTIAGINGYINRSR